MRVALTVLSVWKTSRVRSGPCGADQSHTTHTTSSSEIQPADKCSLFEEARNTKLPVLSAEGVVHAWVGQIGDPLKL